MCALLTRSRYSVRVAHQELMEPADVCQAAHGAKSSEKFRQIMKSLVALLDAGVSWKCWRQQTLVDEWLETHHSREHCDDEQVTRDVASNDTTEHKTILDLHD